MAMYTNNPRYKHFHQEIFTAGDYEQFVSILKDKRKPFEKNNITTDYENTLWQTQDFCHDRWSWVKYKCGNNLFSTFEYLFHKFKKGIYVQIIDNKVNLFLPFSNVDYTNEYTESLTINLNKYKSFEDLYKYICQFEGREYHANKVSWYKNQWYCNNGLVRYEYPIKENDSGINMIYDMIVCLCKERKVPDCEFFINKRDFPILNMYGFEPYTALIPEKTNLYSHNQPDYLPILSMTTKDDFADIPIPTWEDWSRCSNQHDGRTFGKYHRVYPKQFFMEWLQKKPTAVFRGASTGLGVTLDTNPRFFFSSLSKYRNKYWEDGTPYLDASIVKWNIRPRKLKPSDYLDIPNPHELGLESSEEINSYDQSLYRYILHLPGHSCAYRLSLELGMGSVILLYPSEYKLWYFHLLKPFVHYIPLEKGMDKTEIFEKIEWCENNPEEAMNIANNAREFYLKYLSYDSVLDYLQTTCLQLHKKYDFQNTKYNDLTLHFNHIRDNLMVNYYEKDIIPYHTKSEWNIITKTKHTTIYRHNGWIMKETTNHDLGHEHFVSNVLKKEVSGLCPNFTLSSALQNNILYMSHADIGKPFDKYLMSNEFHFIHFKSVLVQIALSLSIAQKKVMFMHYDLSPWNILLQKNPNTNLIYKFYDKTICLKSCKYVAKMIDYEYSSVVHNEEIVHNILPFFFCPVSDMIGLIYHCFHIILKYQRLKHDQIEWIKTVLKEICKEVQWDTNLQNIKYQIHIEKKFSNLILNGEKRSLDKLSNTTLERIINIISFPYMNTTKETNDWSFGNIHSSIYCNDNAIQQMTSAWTLQSMIEATEQSFDMIPTMEDEEYMKSEKDRLKNLDISINFPELQFITSIDTSIIRWYPFCGVEKLSFPIMNELNILYQIIYLHSKGYISDNIYSQTNQLLSSIFTHFSTFVYSNLIKD